MTQQFGILMPTCQVAVNTLVGFHGRGAANSTYFISCDLGVGKSAVLVGFLSHVISLGQIYRYCALLVLGSACLFFLAALPHYRRNRDDFVR